MLLGGSKVTKSRRHIVLEFEKVTEWDETFSRNLGSLKATPGAVENWSPLTLDSTQISCPGNWILEGRWGRS
jgi:hypothetical protein